MTDFDPTFPMDINAQFDKEMADLIRLRLGWWMYRDSSWPIDEEEPLKPLAWWWPKGPQTNDDRYRNRLNKSEVDLLCEKMSQLRIESDPMEPPVNTQVG